jgi:uncharacterized protein (DUF58 family)
VLAAASRRPTSVEELISPALAAALDRLDLFSRRVFAGKLQGERRSKTRGKSVEFEDFRPYVPGDDLRHVDWNVFARLDRFFIKIFLEEQDLALHVVLDASASMDAGNPSKLVFAQKTAMALAYLGLVNNNRVGVWAFGGGEGVPLVRRLPPVRGRRNLQRAAQFILKDAPPPEVQPATTARARTDEFTRALRQIAQTRSGRGVMLLVSDLLIPEDGRSGLSVLVGDGRSWDVSVIQVLSPGELDPLSEVDGAGGKVVLGDLRLTDVETGRAAEVTVTADLVRRYRARLEAHQAGLRSFCSARGIGLIQTRSDADVAALMLDELRRRGLLR